MVRQFLLCILLCFSISAFGQNDIVLLQFVTGAASAAPSNPVYLVGNSSRVSEDRTMLLTDKFKDAKIYVSDSVVVETKARYNIKFDRMEYLAGADTIRQVYPQQVRLVAFEDAIFLPLEYYEDYTIRIGWFEVVTAGDISLLLQREAYKRKTDYNPGAIKLDNFEWDSRDQYYYLPKGVSMPTAFYLSKSNVLKILGDKKPEIQQFMKENKIRIRLPGKLEMVFIKYNQLKAEED